jgi:uncharacterized protein YbjQ (UPF0145 family)
MCSKLKNRLLIGLLAVSLQFPSAALAQGIPLPPEVTPAYNENGTPVRKPIPGGVSTNAAGAGLGSGASEMQAQQAPTQIPNIDFRAGTAQSASVPTQRPRTLPIAHQKYSSPGFLVTTTNGFEGYSILEYKGLVEGAAVREPTWNENASAGIVEPYGGSLDSYAQLCEEARVQSYNTLVTRAKEAGANAVIGVHFDSESFELDKGKFATAVVCVGTAVVVKQR